MPENAIQHTGSGDNTITQGTIKTRKLRLKIYKLIRASRLEEVSETYLRAEHYRLLQQLYEALKPLREEDTQYIKYQKSDGTFYRFLIKEEIECREFDTLLFIHWILQTIGRQIEVRDEIKEHWETLCELAEKFREPRIIVTKERVISDSPEGERKVRIEFDNAACAHMYIEIDCLEDDTSALYYDIPVPKWAVAVIDELEEEIYASAWETIRKQLADYFETVRKARRLFAPLLVGKALNGGD